jgi:hypothetical protein
MSCKQKEKESIGMARRGKNQWLVCVVSAWYPGVRQGVSQIQWNENISKSLCVLYPPDILKCDKVQAKYSGMKILVRACVFV